jgi:N-acetylmuramoyl-L-alanine amidase
MTATGPADADRPASNSNHLVDSWISLETWSQTNNLASPQRLLSATNLVYELHTGSGIITLTAGSQLAHFNGLAYWLGFAPRFANGHFVVHAIDAQKNILPLAGFAEPASGTKPIVVIDPGHGGANVGTRSILNNRFEKEYTLDWALRLQSLLASTGWKVVMTRTNDVDVSLADRVDIAEEAGAGLFISLHFNSAFPHQDQAGFETFCLTPGGLPSTLTRDFEDDPARSFPNNSYDNENLQYGVRLHRAVVEVTGGVDRGVRRARFMGVLRGQSRPAVLLEGGYLSNPREAALIATAEYRQKLAEAVAGALDSTDVPRPPIEAAKQVETPDEPQ